MKKLIFLFLVLTSFQLFAEVLRDVVMKGEAFNKDGKLIYVEMHTYKALANGEITEIQTKYHTADGKLFAEVASTFAKDPFIPDTVATDYRFNEKQELTYNKDTKDIVMTITNTKTGKIKTNTIKRTDNMVSAQGFHNFILRHYDDKKTDIKFIVLPKLDFFSFYFEREPSTTEGYRKFVLKISNWVLRAIVKEIVVEIKDSDHTLRSFEGLTNINSDSNDSQVLKIKLSYPKE